MRQINNWDDIQEATGEFDRPAPGGYIARIVSVEDVEEKEYLRIEWDFEEGAYKGDNAACFNRANFWPMAFIRSCKKTAERFFKAFITSVEVSNQGYHFNPKNPDPYTLEEKLMGVVLGEEEYMKKDGTIGTRTYVYQVRSVEAIRKGDFKVPGLKKLTGQPAAQPASYSSGAFAPLPDDGNVPF